MADRRGCPLKFGGLSKGMLVLCTALLLAPEVLGAQLVPQKPILVLASPEDTRVAIVSEAIVFWNEVFESLGLAPVLGEMRVVASNERRAIETYARRVAQRAGRDRLAAISAPSEPEPPRALRDFTEPVVILLSVQELMPFAWPLPRALSPEAGPSGALRHQYFVALPNRELSTPLQRLSFANIVAHELGHVLGLSHQRGSPGLMCMPCGATGEKAAAEETGVRKYAFRALLPTDLARLRQLYAQPE